MVVEATRAVATSHSDLDRCAICLCDMEPHPQRRGPGLALSPLPCAHVFHTASITPWVALKAWCPLCKTPGEELEASPLQHRDPIPA